MIEQTLEQLGLNKKEIMIYLEILKRGKTTPARVALSTAINRATVYSVAKNLIKKGIISGDFGGKTLYLTADSGKDLPTLLTRDKKVLLEKENLIKKALDEISSLPINTKYAVPSIRFVVEENMEEYLYKQTEKWNQSMSKEGAGCWGFQDHTFSDHFEKWIDNWAQLSSTRGLHIKLWSNESATE